MEENVKSVVINKEDLRYNIEKITEYAEKNLPDDNGKKTKIIAVVKANGYGLGIEEYSKFLIDNGIDFLAVATIEEALKIRQSGITEKEAKILMLSSTAIKEDIKTLIENNITLTIGSKEAAEAVDKIGQDLNKKIKVHLKIDTGFGRYGFIYSNREEMIKTLKPLTNIKIEGTFTHFSNSYYDDKYTKTQFDRFIDCIETLKMNEIETGMLHVCNTSAFIKFPQMHLNAVRIGSAFTGRISFKNSMGLRKIGYLKSNVAEIKELPKDFNVGYSIIPKAEKQVTTINGSALAVTSESKHPKEAYQALEVLTSPEAQKLLAENGRALPSRDSVRDYYYESTSKQEGLEDAIKKSIEIGMPYYVTKNYSEVSTVFNSGMDTVWAGEVSAEDAAKDIQAQVDMILQ